MSTHHSLIECRYSRSIDQPITYREYSSSTMAKYSQPWRVPILEMEENRPFWTCPGL